MSVSSFKHLSHLHLFPHALVLQVMPNPSIERTSYRWLRHRQAAAHVER
jgi:hypothetical protein